MDDMKKAPVLVCCLFLAVFAFSQRTISGRVVNAAGGDPVAGSSVFISNTSIGTVSDRSGYFTIINVPAGRNDLVISSIGYETNVFSFSAEQLPLQLRVELVVKVKELENIIVEPWVEEGWDKWGRMFTENFIGSTPNARHCKIKDEKAIHFRYYKKSNRVIAYCDEPIVIENKALGYTIRYQLEQFEMDYKNSSTSFAGYPFFEDIDKNRKGLQKRWETARNKAFYGSIMHFMRSLYHDSLAAQGYEVRRMVRLPNLERERVKKAYRAAMTVHQNTGTKTVTTGLPGMLSQDSLEYYERIMRQKDYIEVYSRELLTTDSLIVRAEGEYKVLFFTDYLYITYKKEIEDKDYLLYYGEHRNPTFQRSYLWLVNLQPVTIDVNGGYYPPQELYSMAYWGWSEKIADLLPQDYTP
jgi:hypothetical protein